jgi:hypothetical protein
MIAYEPPAQPAIDLAAPGIASTTLVPVEPRARLSRTRLRVRRQRTDVPHGSTVVVAGRLLAEQGTAGLAGRMITLQAFGQGGWHSLAHVLTDHAAHYRLRFRPRRTGSARLRVHFAGDAVDAPASRRLRRLNVYRPVEARSNHSKRPTSFELCVITAESGGNRYSTNGANWSYFQWTPETYNVAARMAGVRQRANPTEASLAEQLKAFRAYEPQDPGAWPVTVPGCS